MIWVKNMNNVSSPARLHAIIARERRRAVVFRRGPSKKVAVIGWNLNTDEFTIGQWFKGRIYEYRCDLSPDGRYLLYFAAKYGINPVDARIEELVKAELGEFDWGNYEGKNVPLKTHEQRAFVFSLQLRSCTGIFLHKKCNFLGAAAKRVWFGVSLLKDRPAGFRANIQLTGGTLSLRRGYILAGA